MTGRPFLAGAILLLAGWAPLSPVEGDWPRERTLPGILLGPGVPPVQAAFEAPRIDPAALGRGGGQPAWPGTRRSAPAPLAVIAGEARRGGTVATGRWEGLDDLSTDHLALWSTHGGVRLSLGAGQRRSGVYAETEVSFGVTRPARQMGRWGWGVDVALGRWQIDGGGTGGEGGPPGAPPGPLGRGGPALGLAVGARVTDALAVALRWREWGGGLAADAPGLAEGGVSARLGGWTLGAALESGTPGRSLRTLVSVEGDFGRRLVLRAGVRPATGETAVGVGIDAGVLVLDIARRDHPRLGAHTALGVTVRAGGAS